MSLAVQIRMARAALNWTTSRLAREASVGRDVSSRVIAGRNVSVPDLYKMRVAFEDAGITFLKDAGGLGAGIRFRALDDQAPSIVPDGTARRST